MQKQTLSMKAEIVIIDRTTWTAAVGCKILNMF